MDGTLREQGMMKISELSRATGVPPSTIRHYVREEILPPPLKTGKTRAYYSKAHLEAIMLIKKMQIEGKKRLPEIQAILKQALPARSMEDETAAAPSSKREEILTAAIELFFEKGYRNTSIADIANRTQMSKETFYLHFRNKEEMFMDCADRIFYDMYNHVWQEIREEKDMWERLRKRGRAFIASYPQWISMMNLVRSLSVGDNPAFREKFHQLLRQMIFPIIREVEQLQREGRFKQDIDSAVAGYILMGMSEYGAALINRGTHTPHEVINCIGQLMQQGVLRPSFPRSEADCANGVGTLP